MGRQPAAAETVAGLVLSKSKQVGWLVVGSITTLSARAKLLLIG